MSLAPGTCASFFRRFAGQWFSCSFCWSQEPYVKVHCMGCSIGLECGWVSFFPQSHVWQANTVKPLLGEPPIKWTPSIKQTLSWVPKVWILSMLFHFAEDCSQFHGGQRTPLWMCYIALLVVVIVANCTCSSFCAILYPYPSSFLTWVTLGYPFRLFRYSSLRPIWMV